MPSNVKISVCHQAPSFRANSTMIWLYQIRTTFGIATARQLHHLGPLVKSTIFITIRCIIIITIAFYRAIIILVIFAKNHLTNIQIFSHDGNSILSPNGFTISTHFFKDTPWNCDIIIASPITRINKSLITIFSNTPIFGQGFRMIEGDIFAAATGFRGRPGWKPTPVQRPG